MHAWAWESLCKPKAEGGLAIRRFKDINIAAGLKLVWRDCTDPDSIWNAWLRTTHVGGRNFCEAPVHLLHSGTWKFIAGSRQLAKKHMKRSIGNGEETSLWHDPWLKEGSHW